MGTRWAWSLVVAMCVLPASAQARERGRDGDARERHPSAGRHQDRGRDSGRREDRSPERGSRQGWTSGDRGSRPAWSGWDRGRRDEREWRGSHREAPRRGWPAVRFRPRYPAYYRYGYEHRHGYYFPRYSFDYSYYPAHGSIRIEVEPDAAEVYVDGYYAGIVDDFDGLFQRLDVAPGPHAITVRLDGFRTWSSEVYAVPGETVKLRFQMLPGPSGEEPNGYDDRGDAGAYDERTPASPRRWCGTSALSR